MSLKANNQKKQTSHAVKRELFSVAVKKRAKINTRFFKTGKGEYGEGDEFIGVTTPNQHKIARKFKDLIFEELEKLLLSKKHECRSVALLIIVLRYKKSDEKEKKKIVSFYLKNLKSVNNWDLVDSSAWKILGVYYLEHKGREKLYSLARSKDLWKKRIGIVSTFAFIRDGKLKLTLEIAEILLKDKHDLIHKATGWMLREVGKKDKKVLITFLTKHAGMMPRTTLRYSIEKFSKSERKKWLNYLGGSAS